MGNIKENIIYTAIKKKKKKTTALLIHVSIKQMPVQEPIMLPLLLSLRFPCKCGEEEGIKTTGKLFHATPAPRMTIFLVRF